MIFLSVVDRHRNKVFLTEIRFRLRKNARLGCSEQEASRKKIVGELLDEGLEEA